MIVLINPNLVVQRNDPLTTGIVYMPVSLAYVAAALREANFPLHLIDAFGEKPRQARRFGNYHLLGLDSEELLARFPANPQAIILYAINLNNHLSLREISRNVKQAFPNVPLIVLENTQSVTGYALTKISDELYEAGADYLLTGEAEIRSVQLLKALQNKEDVAAILSGGKETTLPGLDQLPFPAWDLFPLKNYWSLKFAHGPLSASKYLPLLTSRGCPYPCKFCVIPGTNFLKWRGRSAQNVVDEIEYFHKTLQVSEFHLEDLDPTIDDERTRSICREILKRNLKITWKIAAGTKAETIKGEETLKLMAASGCRYISISPETGSERLLKQMNKPFRLGHALELIATMQKLKIHSQACFVLGFPGETAEDLQLTEKLIRQLTKAGIDEIALFLITPVPGSAIYENFSGYQGLWELTFTPTWRTDYRDLVRIRLKLYRIFLLGKLRYFPFKIATQAVNFARRQFDTKMEMVPYRALVWTWTGIFAKPVKNQNAFLINPKPQFAHV